MGKTFHTVFDILNYVITQHKTPATFCIVKMEMLSILPDARRYPDVSIFTLSRVTVSIFTMKPRQSAIKSQQ